MKNSWQTKKLGDVLEIERGGSPRPINSFLTKAENGINWVKIGDTKGITKYIFETEEKIRPEGAKRSRIVKDGDFILSNSMSFGRPYIMRTTGCIHDGWLLLRDKAKHLDQDFLYYLLSSSLVFDQFNKLAAGSTVRNLNIQLVKSVQVSYPESLPEQQRIVKILDEVFDLAAKAKANAEKNLANAAELFQSYLQSVFANSGKGWEEKTLGEAFDVRDGTHDSPKYHKVGFPLITSKNLKRDELNYDKVQFISKEDYLKINQRSKVDEGDILFAMIGTIGNPVVIKKEPGFAIKNVALFKVPKTQSNYFLKYYLDSSYANSKMQKEAKGTTQKFVGLGYLRSFPITLPSLPEQRVIVSKLDALSAETKKLELIYKQKLSALEELKKSVLKKAFSGEL